MIILNTILVEIVKPRSACHEISCWLVKSLAATEEEYCGGLAAAAAAGDDGGGGGVGTTNHQYKESSRSVVKSLVSGAVDGSPQVCKFNVCSIMYFTFQWVYGGGWHPLQLRRLIACKRWDDMCDWYSHKNNINNCICAGKYE